VCTIYVYNLHSYDLFSAMTLSLMYKLDLAILKLYLHSRNEVSRSSLSKVRAGTGQSEICRHNRIHYTAAFGELSSEWVNRS